MKSKSHFAAYGTDYNPSNTALSIDALNELLKQSKTAIETLTTSKHQHDFAISERLSAFNHLKSVCTRIINALEATDAPKKIIEDAKSINHKIQGKSTQKKTIQEDEKKHISTSQQSYTQLVEHLSSLVHLISVEPSYNPNEEDLKIQNLKTYIEQLHNVNSNIMKTYAIYSNAMIARDKILYGENTGLVDIALSVKKYVKSLFGATSREYKQISKLEFTRH
ncbi:MAG: hypothetical protein ACRC3G_07305 [Bacteroidales bacterium]